MSKPTIIFVNGAWHSPEFFSKVISILEDRGYRCVTVTMPGIGQSPPVKNLDEDIAAVRSTVMNELDNGGDVMIHAHSERAVLPFSFLWTLIYLSRLGWYTLVQCAEWTK
jgi:pimeloyl-ACP methyl ester carboxylesterase